MFWLSSESLQSRADLYELEVLDGLAPICAGELLERLGKHATVLQATSKDAIIFAHEGSFNVLRELRTAVAAYKLLYFKLPRPQSIIEGGHLRRLRETIAQICAREQFRSFRISAAGSDSAAFKRIREAIAAETGLDYDAELGEMLIRFRRSHLKKSFGWEVLIRLTPRPLSARAWRKENMPGALNATIAAALIRQMGISPDQRFFNSMCGSGTLMIERMSSGPCAACVGIDREISALEMAKENAEYRVNLLQADARALPFVDSSFDAVCCDLPWGRLIGARESLGALYRESLGEVTRVCETGGVCGIITQETQLFESALHAFQNYWDMTSAFRVRQSDYRPKIYLLRRRSGRLGQRPV